MKPFEEKWRDCVAKARQAEARNEAAPYGFAARVAARALRPEPLTSEGVWLRMALRSLAGVLMLLVVYAVLELPHLRGRHPLAPGLENTVAALVWTL